MSARACTSAAIALAWLAAGCGGGDAPAIPATPSDAGLSGTGGSCGQVSPCGGSLVGTWTLTGFCVADTASLGIDPTTICALATANAGGTTISGTATFGADGTYRVSETVSLVVALDVPTRCLVPGSTCADLAAKLTPAPDGGAPTSTVTCATTAAGCACRIVGAPRTISESGTETTSGTTLTSTPAGQAPGTAQYCVRGNELHVMTVDPNAPASATGAVTPATDLVGTRP